MVLRKGISAGGAARLLSVLALAAALGAAPATSAGPPGRTAIAPFANLSGQEEIRGIVSLLPRLLSTRLMALAGAEVVLLPPGGKAPEEAAKEAGCALLLQGAVAKVGKGYSIDVTAADPAGGKPAGSFFVAAASEDEIIPQLGALAADIAEKVYGVRRAPVEAAPAPPAAKAPAAPSSLTPPPIPPAASPGGIAPASPPLPSSATTTVTAPGAQDGWSPSSFNRLAQSDRIPDELYGVAAGDVDAAGNGEVIAYGQGTLHIYRVKGNELLPYVRLPLDRGQQALNVATADLDGDGAREILVTALKGENLQSLILKKTAEGYREIAGKIPYYLVVLPDWEGKPVVVGQRGGIDAPFAGRIHVMSWNGKTLAEGKALPANTSILPLASGVLGLSAGRIGSGSKLVYTDAAGRLRILKENGESEYKSKERYGLGLGYFEWGPVQGLENRRPRYPVRMAPRIASRGPEGPSFVLVTEVEKGILDVTTGSYDATRLVLLQWDNGELTERAGTQKSKYFHSGADMVSSGPLARGSRVVSSVIEQEGSAFKDKASRLVLFSVE